MNFKKLLAQSIIWRGFYFFSVLLVNVFLSRYLKAAGAGNLYFLTTIFSFMQVLLGLSFEAGITYFASGQFIGRNKLISLAGLWSVAAGIIMMGFIYLFFLIDHSIGDSYLWSYSLYAFCYVCGQSFMNYLTALYYTQENYFLPNFLLSLVNFAFILILPGKDAATSVAETQKIIYLYFFVFLLSGLILFVAFLISNRKEGTVGFPAKESIIHLLKYSLTALAANVIFFLVYRIDYLFVKVSPVCTDADVGNYIQVSKLGQMMLIVPQIIASVVFPRTASGIERQRLSNSIMVIARLFSQLFVGVFIVVLGIGHYLFIYVFGPTFNKMQMPMLIIIPGIFSLSVLALLSAYFSGIGKLQVNVRGAILALIVMVVGDFLFVLHFGIIAAAIVSTVSYTINLGYSLHVFNTDHDIHFIDFFRWRKQDYYWMKTLLARKSE
jgi:O-antigen/teichoic acid export membrane protein